MRYYSTRNPELRDTFTDAVLNGVAPDGGLYVPESVPRLPRAFFNNIAGMTLQDVCYAVAGYALRDDVDAAVLRRIVNETIYYDMPLVQVDDNKWAMELFHGPTMNFKDTGARFFGRILSYLHSCGGSAGLRELNVVVSTSGNTGSAVANGLLGVPNVHVFVLYPSEVLSPMQEALFTTLGSNVTAIEVNGTIDDCRSLVQQLFADAEIQKKMRFTSATSTNIARLLPHMFHYFWAYACLVRQGVTADNVVVSTPCGNLGNLMAGLVAQKMGLPIKRFVAAENVNHPFVNYLRGGVFEPQYSTPSIAPSLDKGNPRNFERILRFCGGDVEELRKVVSGVVMTDEETEAVIRDVWNSRKYLLDPHSAVAYGALSRDIKDGEVGVALCTEHPVKLRGLVERIIGEPVPLPERMAPLADMAKRVVHVNSGYKSIRNYFLSL